MSRPHSSMHTQSRALSSRASSVASLRAPSRLFRGTILVSVRAKPEDDSNWVFNPPENTLGHPSHGDFQFDHVYDSAASNSQVFDQSVRDIIYKVADGYNGTVFAYGMTGSGKTFSMQGSPQNPGVIPQSVDLLFALLDQTPGAIVKVSYLEIYNDKVCDLLTTEQTEVQLRDDPVRGIKATNLKEITVSNARELHTQIQLGDQLRRTSSTQFNLHSSRSHAVVQIAIQCADRQSVLYLCDLAGSERAVSESARRKEGAFINKSLLTLGSIISKLSTGGGGHLPFRDSKLTRLLQPSLSGNALVSVLCTVRTNHQANTETLSTLRFAARAKNVVVVAHKNSASFEDPNMAAATAVLRQEIALLRAENQELAAAKEDLQGQLDMYMKLDTVADESLESILSTSTRPSTIDSQKEVDRLNDQITDLIHKLAESQHELHRAKQLVHPDVAVQDLLDEIAELKETVADKNKIIDYLKGSSERRRALGAMTSPSKSRMSFAPVPF